MHNHTSCDRLINRNLSKSNRIESNGFWLSKSKIEIESKSNRICGAQILFEFASISISITKTHSFRFDSKSISKKNESCTQIMFPSVGNTILLRKCPNHPDPMHPPHSFSGLPNPDRQSLAETRIRDHWPGRLVHASAF